jgi:fibronectin-binding autotransporter adhesin
VVTIGSVRKVNNNPAQTLDLGGTTTGNAVTGAIENGTTGAVVSVSKSNTSTWTLSGPLAYTGATTVNSGTLKLGTNLTTSASVSVTGGTLELTTGGGNNRVVATPSVSITGEGRLDLTENKLVTSTAPGTATAGVYDGLQREVQRARAGNAWNTPGLTTSMADAKAGKTTIGVSTGKQIRNLGPTQTSLWAGQTITATSTLAMYTYAGDANLDGTIDAGDYGIIDNFVQVADANGYGNGDFNYDGFIDAGDYGIIDNNIQAQGTPFPTGESVGGGGAVGGTGEIAALSGVTAVPEPASLGAFAFAAAALGRRRRRHRCA